MIFYIRVACQESARAGNGETFVVEEPLDFKNSFDVFAAVEAMAAGTLYRLQRGKLRLPVTQHEGLCRGKATDFADAEESFFREQR